MLSRAQREAHATEELVARQPIVVPDRQLEAPLRQFRQRDVLVDEGVVPDGRVGPLHDGGFLLRAAVLVRQKVALAECITGSVGLDRLQVLGLLDEHVQRAPALAGRVGRGGRDRASAKLAQIQGSGGATTAAAAGSVVLG